MLPNIAQKVKVSATDPHWGFYKFYFYKKKFKMHILNGQMMCKMKILKQWLYFDYKVLSFTSISQGVCYDLMSNNTCVYKYVSLTHKKQNPPPLIREIVFVSDIIFNQQAIHSPYHNVRKVHKEIKPCSNPGNRWQCLLNHISLVTSVMILLYAGLYSDPITVEKYWIPFQIPACTHIFEYASFDIHTQILSE